MINSQKMSLCKRLLLVRSILFVLKSFTQTIESMAFFVFVTLIVALYIANAALSSFCQIILGFCLLFALLSGGRISVDFKVFQT